MLSLNACLAGLLHGGALRAPHSHGSLASLQFHLVEAGDNGGTMGAWRMQGQGYGGDMGRIEGDMGGQEGARKERWQSMGEHGG